MQHKIKYYYLCDYASPENMTFGEGKLSDEQIELLRKAKSRSLNCYSIYLEDKTHFTTHYDSKDFLDITRDKLEQWNNG